MSRYPNNPVYAAGPAEIIKSIHDDAQLQVNSLYKTVDKLNAVQWAFDKDKKKLMHALCPPCKDKIQSNFVHVITYVEVGSQTGKSLESGMHEHKRTIELLEQKLEAERLQTDQLKTELRIKDGEIHLLQTERDKLTMHCETLRGEDALQKSEQMTKLQKENEDILSNLKSLQNAVCKQHVEELNTLKDQMAAELEALRGEKESLDKDLMEKRTKVNYQNTNIDRLTLELRNQHSMITESETMLKDLKEQISKLKEDIECMASKKELLEHVIGAKDEALKKLQTDMDTLKQDNHTMDKELSAKEKTVESLTMEMNALKRDQQSLKKNHDMTCKDLNEEIANLKEEISDVSSKRDMLQNDIYSKDDEVCLLRILNAKLEKSLKTLQTDTEKSIVKLSNEVADNSTTIKDLQKDIPKLSGAKDEELLLLKNHQIKKEKDLELLNKERFAMQKDLADQMTNHNIEMADTSSAMEYLQKQIRAKTEEFSWLKTEKCNLSKDLESLKKEKDAMEKDLNKQMTNLRNKLADQTSKVEDLQSTMPRDEELKLLRLDKYSLRQDQETLQTQEDSTEKDLNEQLRKLKVEIADQESKMKELRNTNYEKDEALKNLQMDKETLSRDQETLKTEMEMMTKDHNVQITKLKEELEDMSTQLDVPRHEMYEKDEALKNLQMDKETLSRDQETLKTEMEMMTKDHNVQIAKLKEELEDMSTQLDVPRHEMYQKEEDIKKLQEKIETLQSKGKKVVGLGLCGSSGIGKAMLDMVTKELRRRLIGTLERDDISLTIQPCLKTSEIPKGPIAVICLNMSSIGTTMREALKCVEADKDVIVLVLHHTGKENLPSLTPTHLRVVGREYRSLRGIFDMAFTSESGMYDCDVNNSSVEKMLAILRKY